jgi:uncharacterized membrane protein required for colicin V production
LINHVLGGALGFLEGLIICGVVVFALLVFPVKIKVVSESRLAPYCVRATSYVFYLIPENLKENFKKSYNDIFKGGEKNGERI